MKIRKVVKRTGRLEKFSLHKLEHSLHLAMNQARVKGDAKKLAHLVVAELHKNLKKDSVDVDKIRKTCVKVLRNHKMSKASDYYMFRWLHSKPSKTKKVVKRNGRVTKFHPVRIYKSIQKAMRQTHVKNLLLAAKMTTQVIASIDKKYKGKPVPSEEIRNEIEKVLKKNKHHNAAKHYVLYRYT